VPKAAAISPVSAPTNAIRVESSAGTQVASPFLMTKTPTGLAASRRSVSCTPGRVRPRTLATGTTVTPSAVS